MLDYEYFYYHFILAFCASFEVGETLYLDPFQLLIRVRQKADWSSHTIALNIQ